MDVNYENYKKCRVISVKHSGRVEGLTVVDTHVAPYVI